MRNRYRRMTTRDRILEDLKRAMRDSLLDTREPRVCTCEDCRLARAVDITPDARVLQVQTPEYQRMVELAEGLGWNHETLVEFSRAMFLKPPALLREREAAAVIAHLERGDV